MFATWPFTEKCLALELDVFLNLEFAFNSNRISTHTFGILPELFNVVFLCLITWSHDYSRTYSQCFHVCIEIWVQSCWKHEKVEKPHSGLDKVPLVASRAVLTTLPVTQRHLLTSQVNSEPEKNTQHFSTLKVLLLAQLNLFSLRQRKRRVVIFAIWRRGPH